MTLLAIQDLVVVYGKKQVLHGVSLEVGKGEIVALIGHNGAGKTTLMRSTLGLGPRQSGRASFDGVDMPADDAVGNIRRGIAFVSQGRNTFRSMTIAENLGIAISSAGSEAESRIPLVEEMFPMLRDRRRAVASTLSGGQQQMLALALAILRGPRLIMLDEPSTGLAPVLVSNVFKQLVELRDRLGMSILVVDQNVRQLMTFCDRLVILKAGSVIYDGAATGIGDDQQLWSLF